MVTGAAGGNHRDRQFSGVPVVGYGSRSGPPPDSRIRVITLAQPLVHGQE